MLVFTQYVAMGRLLEQHLAEPRHRAQFLHGGVRRGARAKTMVDGFQAGECPVFLLSLKAGGVGLNLTRATHVVHYDRWWNPAVEDQATDRGVPHRSGPAGAGAPARLEPEPSRTGSPRCSTTKRELADAVVGAGEAWLSELSDDELADARRRWPTTPEVDAMSRRRFAPTWWGQAWVDALEQRARSTRTVSPAAAPTPRRARSAS